MSSVCIFLVHSGKVILCYENYRHSYLTIEKTWFFRVPLFLSEANIKKWNLWSSFENVRERPRETSEWENQGKINFLLINFFFDLGEMRWTSSLVKKMQNVFVIASTWKKLWWIAYKMKIQLRGIMQTCL